jgi:hypothetical protein
MLQVQVGVKRNAPWLLHTTVAQVLRMAPLPRKTLGVEQDNMSCGNASCSLSVFSKDGCNIGEVYVPKGCSGLLVRTA